MNKTKIIETMNLIDDELVKEASVTSDSPDKSDITVSGVEEYRPHRWRRYALVACSFLMIAGVVAGGKMMLNNRAPMLPEDAPSMPCATIAPTEPQTAEGTGTVQTEKPSSAAVPVKTENVVTQAASSAASATEPETETQPDEAEEEVTEKTTVGEITEEAEQVPATTGSLLMKKIITEDEYRQMYVESEEETTQSTVSEPDEFSDFNIYDSLAGLSYVPYTCDGLPEYVLNAPDGTIYWLNLSTGWVWRRNTKIYSPYEEREEAHMTEAQISYLNQHGTELGMYPTQWN